MDAGRYEQLDQQTVLLRVQVIDMNSFTLDLRVPTYLPARDLTQRVARDAGLDAYWPDGRRRLYWLRARGRLVQDHESLADLGVINGELVYLLPEPPPGSGVAEQPPDYPVNRGYAGKGTLAVVASVLGVFLYGIGWGVALSVERTPWTLWAPGIGMGLLCTSFARHGLGGQGKDPRLAIYGLLLLLVVIVVTGLLPWLITGEDWKLIYSESVTGLVFGIIGVLVGWLAWGGAVEPLPAIQAQVVQAQEAVAVVPCALCSGQVTAEVRMDCPYRCGRYFHIGCYKAKMSVYRGDPRLCGVCGARVG